MELEREKKPDEPVFPAVPTVKLKKKGRRKKKSGRKTAGVDASGATRQPSKPAGVDASGATRQPSKPALRSVSYSGGASGVGGGVDNGSGIRRSSRRGSRLVSSATSNTPSAAALPRASSTSSSHGTHSGNGFKRASSLRLSGHQLRRSSSNLDNASIRWALSDQAYEQFQEGRGSRREVELVSALQEEAYVEYMRAKRPGSEVLDLGDVLGDDEYERAQAKKPLERRVCDWTGALSDESYDIWMQEKKKLEEAAAIARARDRRRRPWKRLLKQRN